MIEFAAGILIGGSVGAVIMGALLSQVRGASADTAHAAHAGRVAMPLPRQTGSSFARQMRTAEPLSMLVPGHAALATTPARLH